MIKRILVAYMVALMSGSCFGSEQTALVYIPESSIFVLTERSNSVSEEEHPEISVVSGIAHLNQSDPLDALCTRQSQRLFEELKILRTTKLTSRELKTLQFLVRLQARSYYRAYRYAIDLPTTSQAKSRVRNLNQQLSGPLLTGDTFAGRILLEMKSDSYDALAVDFLEPCRSHLEELGISLPLISELIANAFDEEDPLSINCSLHAQLVRIMGKARLRADLAEIVPLLEPSAELERQKQSKVESRQTLTAMTLAHSNKRHVAFR